MELWILVSPWQLLVNANSLIMGLADLGRERIFVDLLECNLSNISVLNIKYLRPLINCLPQSFDVFQGPLTLNFLHYDITCSNGSTDVGTTIEALEESRLSRFQ